MLSCLLRRTTMGAASGKEAFRTAIVDLVNNQQVCERAGDGCSKTPRSYAHGYIIVPHACVVISTCISSPCTMCNVHV